ncbi:g6750 [Coccomyxa viridis]|uniref:G6750 protein n=1 Tax=Coccomyxa viridis TaxID=1274662 RepID=A0ABP1FW53_9CHLO
MAPASRNFESLTARILNDLDKGNEDIRVVGVLGEACWANIWILNAIAAALCLWLLTCQARMASRGRRAITASLGAIMALCVMISIVMVAQPAALLATDMTLSKGLMKAGKVYGLAEEALVGVQQELEARLQPPQDLQDTLYKAKDGLPVPPDPVKSALDAFAKQALGNIVAPAVQGMQAAVQKGLDSQAASLTEHNDALAQLIALLEQVDATSAAQQSQHSVQQCSAPCVDLRQYSILHSSACICAQGSLAGMRVDADEAARHAGRAILGGGLAFMGYLALLCQCLVTCGQVRGGGGGGHAKQQYQQLPLQEDGVAVSGQKRPGNCEDGSAILELTATAAEIV